MTAVNQPKPGSTSEPVALTLDFAEGWVETTLDQLLQTLESGSRPKGGVRGIKEGILSIGGEHLDDTGGFRFQSIKFVPHRFFECMNRGRIQAGDILIVKDGATTGKVALARDDFPYNPAVVNEHVFICRPATDISPSFLFYFLFSKDGQDRILENFRGSAQGGINQSFAAGTAVPLAPISEQKRIVAKVEQLLSSVNAARERLAKVPTILKRFRQSVLAAACSGRLTADWRVDSEIKSSGTQILDFIAPKRNSCEKSTDINSAWHFLYNPRSWDWAFLSEIAESRLGKMLDKKKNVGVPTKYLRNINVRWFGFDLNGLQEMKATKEDRKKLCLCDGDVLVCEGGEPGRAAVWENNTQGLIYQKALHRIRLKGNIQPKWLAYNLWVDADSKRLDSLFTGTTIKHLTGKSIAKYPIAIPPIGEQKELVRRVEALFKLADAIEKRVAGATAQAEKLTQAILAKAFRGELIPTEAELARREGRSYESAAALLAKIEAQRKDVKPQRKRGKSVWRRNK
jgi:type I restriction enzyme S subunit